jgi:uncharacterized membrane protein YuzA (DUF378 family)
MWWIDFPTLVLMIVGGLLIGVQGVFGVDLTTEYLNSSARIAQIAIGASALWQLSRQRLW